MTNSVKISLLLIVLAGITTLTMIRSSNDTSGAVDTQSETEADATADSADNPPANVADGAAAGATTDAVADGAAVGATTNTVAESADSSPTNVADGAATGATTDAVADGAAESGHAEYRKISSAEAKTMMDDGDVNILDVRTEAEYAEAHVPGAMLLPDSEVGGRAADLLPDKNSVILVYCRSGGRSARAARELVGMGYTNVYDFGGIIDWPYDTVK